MLTLTFHKVSVSFHEGTDIRSEGFCFFMNRPEEESKIRSLCVYI